MTWSKSIVGTVALAACVYCQTPPRLEFEVATIKPASMPTAMDAKAGKLHMGVTIDAQRVDIGFLSLHDLMAMAYRVKRYQIEGPAWINSQRFDIQAKLPDGASSDQVPEMLQALLAERFKLTMHRETKEHPVYALVVGKNGLKLKEAPADAPTFAGPGSGGAAPEVKSNSKGAFVVNGGALKMEMRPNGVMHYEFAKMNLEGVANFLTPFLDRPVLDRTELKGNYEIALDLTRDNISMATRSAGVAMPPPENRLSGGANSSAMPADAASDPSGGSLFQAVQQLGLKLEARKEPIEMIVVDHIEKTPTEN